MTLGTTCCEPRAGRYVMLVLVCLFVASLSLRCVVCGSVGVGRQRFVRSSNAAMTVCKCTSGSALQLTCQTPPNRCDSNEAQFEGSCYLFSNEITSPPSETRSSDDSQLYCIQRNSHLVYIESKEEQTFLADNAQRTKNYWIGLIPEYTWLDGSLLDQDLLAVTGNGGSCSALVFKSAGLGVKRSNCENELAFICEFRNEGSGCESAVELGESCYTIKYDMLNYENATNKCAGNGGKLISIETQAGFDSIKEKLTIDIEYWIGLDLYAWMDGSPAVYTSFHSQYDRTRFQLREMQSFNWEGSKRANENNNFICERKLSTLSVESAPNTTPETCTPAYIPVDLVRLSLSGSLCFRNWGENPPVLYDCVSGGFLEECGCITGSNDEISCSCGSCQLDFSDSELNEWSSNFNCTCAHEEEPFNVTVVDGQTRCEREDPESPTTPQLDITDAIATSQSPGVTTTSGVSTTNPLGGSGGQDGVDSGPIGIIVGVILASVFILVALVAFFLWRRRDEKSCWKTYEGGDKSGASYRHDEDSSTDNLRFNPTYGVGKDGQVIDDVIHVATPNPMNVYISAKADNDSNGGDAYTTIPSDPYTALKPKDGRDGEYTHLQSPMHDGNDEYTPIPKNNHQPRHVDVNTNDDADYVEPDYVEPEPVLPAFRVAAHNIDVQFGSDKKKNDGYVQVDAPDVVFGDQSKDVVSSNQNLGDSNYYLKLEKPDDPISDLQPITSYGQYQSLGVKATPSPNKPTEDGAYETQPLKPPISSNAVNHANHHQSGNDIHGTLDVNPTNGAYDTVIRNDVKLPQKYKHVSPDEGDYSLPSRPLNEADYDTFTRNGKKPPPLEGHTSGNTYGSLITGNSSNPDESEYTYLG